MHPNLLNFLNFLNLLRSLRRKNHKGTRFARGRKSKLNHGDTESTEKCKEKARFRLVVFKLRVLCVSVVKNLAGRGFVGMIHS